MASTIQRWNVCGKIQKNIKHLFTKYISVVKVSYEEEIFWDDCPRLFKFMIAI